MQNILTNYMWGKKAHICLFIISCLLLFTMLDAREIWTQEHRWADIVSGMFYRGDFLHPYLGKHVYYDKPLLSYWFIALTAKLHGRLDVFALRFPSAFAGLIAVVSIYTLGATLRNKKFGLMSGWLLLTTFYFLFWARTSSADMLNLAGSLLATAWYIKKRDEKSFFNYFVFFLIIALTSLCKGLVGAIIPAIAIMSDLALRKKWKEHFNLSFLVAFLMGFSIYILPFLASSFWEVNGYSSNGLYMVYRENFLRYFHPFDHQGNLYTYLIFLPIYLFPWTFFFIPALYRCIKNYSQLDINAKWFFLTLILLFLFFTLSGSRRSYYVLPIVPFAILVIVDWFFSLANKQYIKLAQAILFCVVCFFLNFAIIPNYYYKKFGAETFAKNVLNEAKLIAPLDNWQFIFLDAESKLKFYLNTPPEVKNFDVNGERDEQTTKKLVSMWPILEVKPKRTIFVTRKQYADKIELYFKQYQRIELHYPSLIAYMFGSEDSPIAFIPTKEEFLKQ